MKGYYKLYKGKYEPTDRRVLWLKPTDSGKQVLAYFFGSGGWTRIFDYEAGTGVVVGEDTIELDSEYMLQYATGLLYDGSSNIITLTNSNGDVLATIDTTDFVKDGMLSSVEYTTTDADEI